MSFTSILRWSPARQWFHTRPSILRGAPHYPVHPFLRPPCIIRLWWQRRAMLHRRGGGQHPALVRLALRLRRSLELTRRRRARTLIRRDLLSLLFHRIRRLRRRTHIQNSILEFRLRRLLCRLLTDVHR